MKLNKLLTINSERKLALVNTVIFAFISLILYFALPSVLNYPPNSIDNDFQVQIVGIKYSHQFLILVAILLILLYITFRFVYSKMSLSKNKNNLEAVRKKAFNYPYFMFLLECFIPTIIVIILLFAFHTEFELVVRISTVVFSFCSVFAIFSYMISKSFFTNKLIEISKLTKSEIAGIRLQLYKKLILQVLPLFLYSFVIILLISISLMTIEKGDLLNHFYKQELLARFPDNKIYTLSEIKEELNSIELKSEGDHIFIMSAKDGSIYYSPEKLNDFFVTYTMNFYDEMDGYTYEYYGQNREGTVIKLNTTEGQFFVGIRYYVFANTFIVPFILIAVLLICVNGFFIFYIGKDLSNDINSVVFGMHQISNSKDVIYAHNLPITSNDEIGDLTLAFNEIQVLTKTYVEQIHDNQEILMERERLASLGQLIGGIAHNLKTPIMSISGAAEGLTDLITEYEQSVGDSEVTVEDHHAIAKDMKDWIEKIRSYTEYMSDVITAVKGQAVTMSEEQAVSFTLDELVKRVNILMRHELKNALINLNIQMKAEPNTVLKGNINSLVQVINNMISNAIQAYNGKTGKEISLILELSEKNVVISIQDSAGGLSDAVKAKLFKEMITTKGKNGTGLGLFMSYSTIRAHFNGNITFETEKGKGTTFHISLPV